MSLPNTHQIMFTDKSWTWWSHGNRGVLRIKIMFDHPEYVRPHTTFRPNHLNLPNRQTEAKRSECEYLKCSPRSLSPRRSLGRREGGEMKNVECAVTIKPARMPSFAIALAFSLFNLRRGPPVRLRFRHFILAFVFFDADCGLSVVAERLVN